MVWTGYMAVEHTLVTVEFGKQISFPSLQLSLVDYTTDEKQLNQAYRKIIKTKWRIA